MSLKIKHNDVLTVASGTLSCGVSASISGGNFWHGIRQGAITSGLNHIVNHYIGKAKIDKQFDGTGINPDGLVPNTPNELLSETIKIKEFLPELIRLDKQAGYPGVELGRKNELNLNNKNIVIKHTKNPYTYRQLAITIGHELVHAFHVFNSSLYSDWIKALGNNVYRAVDFSEVQAYKWEVEWGGNINYAAPKSPSQYLESHKNALNNYNIFRLYPKNYY